MEITEAKVAVVAVVVIVAVIVVVSSSCSSTNSNCSEYLVKVKGHSHLSHSVNSISLFKCKVIIAVNFHPKSG